MIRWTWPSLDGVKDLDPVSSFLSPLSPFFLVYPLIRAAMSVATSGASLAKCVQVEPSPHGFRVYYIICICPENSSSPFFHPSPLRFFHPPTHYRCCRGALKFAVSLVLPRASMQRASWLRALPAHAALEEAQHRPPPGSDLGARAIGGRRVAPQQPPGWLLSPHARPRRRRLQRHRAQTARL